MVNKSKLVDEDVGVALPCAFSCDLVNEQGVWLFGCPIGGRFICDAVKMRLVYSALKIHDTLSQTILFADVLQTLDTNVGDADAVRHEVCLNEHFVFATFLEFNTL